MHGVAFCHGLTTAVHIILEKNINIKRTLELTRCYTDCIIKNAEDNQEKSVMCRPECTCATIDDINELKIF